MELRDNLSNDEMSEHQTQSPPPQQQQPDDSPHAVLFFLLGNASLLAFETFLNSIDILNYSCKCRTMGMAINRAPALFVVITAVIFSIIKPRNPIILLIVGLSFQFIIVCTYPITLIVNTNAETQHKLTVAFLFLIGIFTIISFSCSYKFASRFNQSSYTFMTSGTGCCGVLASSLRISTKSAFFDESQLIASSNSYFFIPAAIILATLIYFIIKLRDPTISSRFQGINGIELTHVFSMESVRIIKKNWPYCLAIMFNSFITYSLFPGYLTSVVESPEIGDWTPVIVTSVFCIFDLVGESFALKMWRNETKFMDLIVAFARSLLYPVFIISIKNVINLGEPVWTFCWTIVFAVSNGFVKVHVVICSVGAAPNVQVEVLNLEYFWVALFYCVGAAAGVVLTYGIAKIQN